MARRDHSESKTANPTKAIRDCYEVLMAETDPAKLRADVLELVRAHGGISDLNRLKFERTILQIGDNLTKMQGYVTNFMLAGMGMGVTLSPR